MMNNISIKFKLPLLSFVSIIIVSVIVAVTSIIGIQGLSEKNIENFKKEAYAKKEESLKNYVSLAIKTVNAYYKRTSKEKVKAEVQELLKNQSHFLFSILEGEYKRLNGKIPKDELKERLRNIIKDTRYGKTGYFWVNDTNAVIVMHPFKPQLDGKNLSNFKDKGGKKIFSVFAKIGKEKGSGFVDYLWPKPGFDKPQDKVSFVKLFKPFNWVIGTGEYITNVTEQMKKEALITISEERYGKDGYFWINDSDPKMVMHPFKPKLNGKDLSGFQDKSGKYIFKNMVKVTNESSTGGLIKYMWPKPGSNKPFQKFSYVQKFGPWDWIIGTGAYVDDIEKEILLMQENTQNEIQNVITKIIIFTLIAILITFLISYFIINRGIVYPLQSLNNGIKKLTQNNSLKENKIEKSTNDEIGELVDSFNGYMQKLQSLAKQDEKVISEVENIINKVNRGFFVYKVTHNSENEQVQKLKSSINSMIEQTEVKLREISNTLIEYGNSNFDYKSKIDEKSSHGIMGSISSSTKILGGNVSELLAMITLSGDKLNNNVSVLTESTKNLSQSANEQAASLEQTAAALEEITSSIQNGSEKINKMSNLTKELHDSAKEGETLASKTTLAMEEIDTQVTSINDAITVIDQIAFQTNILSLNAAVEAATAGEAGKGFAVVAQEVRNLASRSAEAAKEIKELVESATAKANEGKSIANNMISGYSHLNIKVDETITLINSVSDDSKEQEEGIIQINDAVNSLDKTTQINATSVNEINELSNEVLELSDDLLKVAHRAKYDKSKVSQVCDVDLVFKTAQLKNDHIIFKNNNFTKISNITKEKWTVTKETECNLGSWILKEERENSDFTKSSNWSRLKEEHIKVHELVQNFINENAKDEPNDHILNQISKDLEEATSCVFETLDIVKLEQCKIRNGQKTVQNVSENNLNTEVIKETNISVQDIYTPKVINPIKNEEEDEWESF